MEATQKDLTYNHPFGCDIRAMWSLLLVRAGCGENNVSFVHQLASLNFKLSGRKNF